MTKPVILALLGGVALSSCTSGESAQDGKAGAPVVGSGTAKCNLNTQNPGPLIRGGLARVKIEGKSVSVDRKDVPALCGPLYNFDVPKLDAKAGDGLLLETCFAEGNIQVTSYKKSPGKQRLHGNQEPEGTEVVFNRHESTSYSSRGIATDSVTVSQDFWHATIDVELVDVMGSEKLEAKVTFDCPNPSPLELQKLEEEKAKGAAAAPGTPTPSDSAETPTQAPPSQAPAAPSK